MSAHRPRGGFGGKSTTVADDSVLADYNMRAIVTASVLVVLFLVEYTKLILFETFRKHEEVYKESRVIMVVHPLSNKWPTLAT